MNFFRKQHCNLKTVSIVEVYGGAYCIFFNIRIRIPKITITLNQVRKKALFSEQQRCCSFEFGNTDQRCCEFSEHLRRILFTDKQSVGLE